MCDGSSGKTQFSEVTSKPDFAALEHRILDFWEQQNIFQRSIDQREGAPDFVFYDGPPGTNGQPHIGHMMQSALKDLWPRYKTMQGFRVLRKAGWDTHGLPVELRAEKELGLESKRDIEQYGVEKFADYCRETVFRFKSEWIESIRRIGRFLDTDHDYATLTNEYIQSDWWVFKQAWDKGLVYRDYKVMPYCSRCGTSLSAHELAQGYKDITDLTLTAKFRAKDEPATFYLAWTTTAWTLLANVALAVSPELTYVKVQVGDQFYILAEALVETVLAEQEFRVVSSFTGRELEGLAYEPLWDFHTDRDPTIHHIVVDDYVTAAEGTGIVHLALYGEDDFRLIRKYDLPIVQPIGLDGLFSEETGSYAGRYFIEEGMEVEILKDLAARGLLFDRQKYEHSYPHCYKCDTKLMYYAKTSWFIRTSAYKEEMLAANAEINWYPPHIKDGRFGRWLEHNVDWAISRERYWGSPLPVWSCRSEECGHQLAIATIEELAALATEPLPPDFDLHIPHIDQVPTACPQCGAPMKREPEVLDCWYNAGLMPWGQWGYPHAAGSTELFDNQYPAEFICEGLDQTRGWFYTMLAVSTLLTGRSSYRNVICTGLIADAEGRKMSKTIGNIVNPMDMFEKYGADAVRWIFFNSHPWQAKRFTEETIQESLKQIIIPFWNVYSFFVTYARIDNWQPVGKPERSDNELDRWISSATQTLVEQVSNFLDVYDVAGAAKSILDYIDSLSNWYVRRSRRRFWKSENDTDKEQAYWTLNQALLTTIHVLAPFLPFITETMYHNLHPNNGSGPESIHLSDYPQPDESLRDTKLEHDMQLIYRTVTLGRALRNQHQLKVRQPLARMLVVVGDISDQPVIERMRELISEELNVKQVEVSTDEQELVELTVKPNFRVLGKRAGGSMKQLAEEITRLTLDSIRLLEQGEKLHIMDFDIEYDDILINRQPREGLQVMTQEGVTVALETELTPELLAEGLAREFINRVQNMRKDAGFNVTDRIRVSFNGSQGLRESVAAFGDYICRETLANGLDCCETTAAGARTWSLNEEQVTINVEIERG